MSNEFVSGYMQEIKPEWEQQGYTCTTTSSDGNYTEYEVKPYIPRVGHFEKVSLEQFTKDMKEEFDDKWSDEEIIEMWNSIILPTRATSGSAGYDFKAPFEFELTPNASIKIPTGIRCVIKPGWFLGCIPRSGLGFKYEVRLFNSFGLIDMDYAQSKNEGHIYVKFRNGEKHLKVKQGEGIFQSMLLPFGVTDDDNAEGERDGGFGSTNKEKNGSK